MTDPAALAARPTTPRAVGVPTCAAMLVVALLVLTGCAGGQGASVVPPTPPTPAPSGSVAPAGAAATTPARRMPPHDPTVVRWGRDGRLLSIVVRNTDRREVVSGLLRISLSDRTGRVLLATTGPPASKCCTLLSVPPGRPFGLFLSLHDEIVDVAHVSVAFADPQQVRLERWSKATGSRVLVTDPRLTRTATDAVVSVGLEPRTSRSPYLAGQAFLRDPHGHLVAVISGRFYCFEVGHRRRVRMALQHPVPAGTRLGAVVAYPLPPHVHPHVGYSCPSETS